jgi:hypothetical protein
MACVLRGIERKRDYLSCLLPLRSVLKALRENLTRVSAEKQKKRGFRGPALPRRLNYTTLYNWHLIARGVQKDILELKALDNAKKDT